MTTRELVPATVGVSTSRAVLSGVLRAALRSPVSHAWITLPWFGEEMVVEAVWSGVRPCPVELWRRDNAIVLERRIELDRAAVMRAIGYMAEPYDYLGIARFGLRLAAQAIVAPLPIRLAWKVRPTPTALLCSELVSRATGLFPGNPEWCSPLTILRTMETWGQDRPVLGRVPVS